MRVCCMPNSGQCPEAEDVAPELFLVGMARAPDRCMTRNSSDVFGSQSPGTSLQNPSVSPQWRSESEAVNNQKKWRKHERKKNLGQEFSETTTESNTCKSEMDSAETLPDVDLPSPESLAGSLTTSRSSKNQNFLSRYVKSILGGITTQYNCEYCEETFTNEENFNSHKKKHEREKETCVLCKKVFYKPKEFIQHLLTHESVDKVSCKKCMKYFPSQKKFRTHCKNFHLMSSKTVEPENKTNLEHLKKKTPRYECKRCQLEFDSEENIRVHKRNHIKMDLVGAYLLSNKKYLT